MTTVSLKEFADWVRAQPDERPVDMDGNRSEDPCGCLMVLYAKDNFPDCPDEFLCTFDGWELTSGALKSSGFASFEKNTCLSTVVSGGVFNTSKTFGEVKKDLIY